MSYSPNFCVCLRERESVSEKKTTRGDCVERQRDRRRKLCMIVITLTGNLSGNRSGRAGLKQGADVAVWKWSPRKKPNNRKESDADHRHRKHSARKKGDTPLGYSGRIGLSREQCGVFTPCKNRNLETRSRDYATVEEALFYACWVELCRVVPNRASLVARQQYKHLDDAKLGRGYVTASAVTSYFSTVTQQ
jgi:hypothetical protein